MTTKFVVLDFNRNILSWERKVKLFINLWKQTVNCWYLCLSLHWVRSSGIWIKWACTKDIMIVMFLIEQLLQRVWRHTYVQLGAMKGSSWIFFRKSFPTNECMQRNCIHMKISLLSCVNYDINIIWIHPVINRQLILVK